MDESHPDDEAARRWQLLQQLFEQGLELPPLQRETWLFGLELDADLAVQLRGLLDADTRDDDEVGSLLTRRIGDSIADAAALPGEGERVGPYRLLQELGSGGGGVVFLAERADQQFEQQVAIKFIRGIASGEAVRQLRHERQVLADLAHPGIARLLDGGETEDGQPYLVMEYVRGEPISTAVRNRALSLRQRLALLQQVAEAVHFAHQRLVIHRDIKPDNVLLREDGRPVLLDFGIAKLLQPGEAAAGVTQVWFTPAYASPEQRRGDAVSTATDIYALGALLFELVTDRPPPKSGRIGMPSSCVPADRRTQLSGDIDCIVARACASEPQRRYPSAEALAADLDRHLEGRPVLAAPDSAAYRAGKFLRRHRWGSAAAVLALCVLAAFGWRLADERNRALRAEAAALSESAAASSVTDFLIALFGDARPGQHLSRSITPLELADRGRARLLASDSTVAPPQRARLLGALGQIYVNLGEPRLAAETLQAAVDVSAALDGYAGERVAHLAALGQALLNRADNAGAERVYAEARQLAEQSGDAAATARAGASLALAIGRQGRVAEAHALYDHVERQTAAALGPDSVDAANVQSYRAELLRTEGRLDEARAEMQGAIRRLDAQLSPDDPERISALGLQAELLREMGEYVEAERLLLEMLALRQRTLSPDSDLISQTLSALGSVYYDQGRTADAIGYFEQALQISERTLAADDPSLAIDRNNLASLLEEQGNWQAALPLFQQALDSILLYPRDHAERIAQFRLNTARVLMLLEDPQRARVLLEHEVPDGELEGLRFLHVRRLLMLAEWERRFGNAEAAAAHLAAVESGIEDFGGRDGPRYVAVLRQHGLLAHRDGKGDEALRHLEAGYRRYESTFGAAFVGSGELALELAEICRQRNDDACAAYWRERAVLSLEPLLAAQAPLRQRLRAL